MNAKITGTGRYLPEYVLNNEELSRMVDTSDEWIVTHTGMRERRIAQGEKCWEMGVAAAQKALHDAGVAPEQVDMIIGCSSTPDYLFPPVSCIIQGKLGAKNAFCIDQMAACSAFVFALQTARQYIENRAVKTVLIVCTEQLSKVTDYTDRATCVLFGDGAGAAVVQAAEAGGVLAANCATDGTGWDLLACNAIVHKTPFEKDRPAELPQLHDQYLYMAGHEVFKFAVRAMSSAIDQALADAGLSAGDIKFLVPHQANVRIIQTMARRYGFPMDRVVLMLEWYGNTSSASIPIALDELSKSGALARGDKLILVGFGGGLTYGAAVVEW